MSDFTGLLDLAAKRLGGMVLEANDEFFAAKENLLEPAAPVYDPQRYGDRGKVMDGWESRRRRTPGHDWCVVRLGLPGVVRGVAVDTAFFTGNYAEGCSLDGCSADSDDLDGCEWVELLPRVDLKGDARNAVGVEGSPLVTHVRLNIYPDGGVARLRIHGEALCDPNVLAGTVDLASVTCGGSIVACSDAFFSGGHNLVMVGDARNMGDGWETRRRRGPGNDWIVVCLATEGTIERAEIDTTHFKGNYPESCSLEVADDPDGPWTQVLARTRLRAHYRHAFDITEPVAATHARLSVYPDGGVARLRLHGSATEAGLRAVGLRRLNALLAVEAERQLLACCGSRRWAREVAARRPFADGEQLAEAADEVWAGLGPDDHAEAVAAHPRIGADAQIPWSRQEQSNAVDTDEATAVALAEGNRAYEERFGRVFLICATGLDGDEILAALRERLGNDPETETRVVVGEQAKITRLRLDKLLGGER